MQHNVSTVSTVSAMNNATAVGTPTAIPKTLSEKKENSGITSDSAVANITIFGHFNAGRVH